MSRENKDKIGKLLVYALACSDVKKEYATEKEKKKRKTKIIIIKTILTNRMVLIKKKI